MVDVSRWGVNTVCSSVTNTNSYSVIFTHMHTRMQSFSRFDISSRKCSFCLWCKCFASKNKNYEYKKSFHIAFTIDNKSTHLLIKAKCFNNWITPDNNCVSVLSSSWFLIVFIYLSPQERCIDPCRWNPRFTWPQGQMQSNNCNEGFCVSVGDISTGRVFAVIACWVCPTAAYRFSLWRLASHFLKSFKFQQDQTIK